MRIRPLPLLGLALAAAPLLAACEDSLGLGDPTFRTDTLTLVAPTAPGGGASAIDIVEGANFLRRPENLGDAQAWDFALRQSGAAFSLLPNDPVASSLRGSGIQRSTRTFAQLNRAPTRRADYQETLFAIAEGDVLLLRSREWNGIYEVCVNYAKAQVLDVDAQAGTVELVVRTSAECSDDRLED